MKMGRWDHDRNPSVYKTSTELGLMTIPSQREDMGLQNSIAHMGVSLNGGTP